MNEFLNALDARQPASIALSANGARFIPGDDTLIVTFQPFTDADDPEEFSPQAVWAEKFLHKRGFSVLGVNRQDNNWYRAADLHALLRALQQRGFFGRYRRVMFYGGSMGGFAALTFAELSPGCTVLAHNPQTTLRASATPWETRFQVAQQQDWLGDFSDGAVGARAAARVYVSYDPFDRKDSLHIARLDSANLVPLRVPMVGHQMPVWLLQMKLLGAIFDAALAGSLDVAGFRRMARARFELPHYLLSLAARSRNPALQQYLGEKARGLLPQRAAPRDYLWALAKQRAAGRAPGVAPTLIWTVDGCRADDVMAWIRTLRPDAHTALEPFSGPCKPHDLAALLRKPSHGPMVHDEIQRLLSGSQVLLHRIAAGPTRFEAALLSEARGLGFSHVLLHRRDAGARLAETPAVATAADGDEARAQRVALAKQSLLALASLQAEMQARGDPCQVLALEALVPATARPGDEAAVAALCGLLGLPPEGPRPALAATSATRHGGTLLPPADPALTEALAWIPTLDEGEAFLRAEISHPHQPACAALDALPPVLREQDTLRLSGLALTPPDAVGFTRLLVEQGDAQHDARWHQPSPGGPARFPGHADASQARFGHVVLQVDSRHDIHLRLRPKAGTASIELARIAFHPLNRRRIAGLFLGPWRMGFKPLAGVASLALSVALHRLMNAELGLPEPTAATDGERRRCYEQRASDISGAPFKFAVLRDPVERFTTLLRRQVVEPRLRVPGLPTAPDLATFIAQFDRYLQVPTLRACFESQARQLVQPERFDGLYRLEDLSPLRRDLLQRTGRELTLAARPAPPLLQRLGWAGPRKLPADALQWIRERYADDVALWERLGG